MRKVLQVNPTNGRRRGHRKGKREKKTPEEQRHESRASAGIPTSAYSKPY